MVDTQRNRADLLTIFADNVTGQISEQDLRDFLVTVMEEEFAYTGDFWKEPDGQYITTDRSGKGWIDYSQTVSEACSFGDILMRTNSGTWVLADFNGDIDNAKPLGVALDSYVASTADGQVLRKGLIKHSLGSVYWSEGIGTLMYLDSGTAGKMSNCSAANMSVKVCVGWAEQEASDVTTTGTDVFRFEPGWGILDR
jgi:hypothetical protein